MARPLRIEFSGAYYHVMARGNARLPVFENDTDRKCFLTLLETVADRFNFSFHAYCLMDNHYHLLVETPDANLSKGMRHINGVYTQSFNRRHGRSGHVFQGRYKAIIVDEEEYLAELGRYIVLNPVRAGLAKKAGQYVWSSFRQTAGLASAPGWLTVSPLLSRFGDNKQNAQAAYRRFVHEDNVCDDLTGKISGGLLLGSQRFNELISKKIRGSERLTEIPASARFASRPLLDKMVPKEGFPSKLERNCAIVKASRDYGYSYTAIGKAFSLHYSSVSIIVKSMRDKTL